MPTVVRDSDVEIVSSEGQTTNVVLLEGDIKRALESHARKMFPIEANQSLLAIGFDRRDGGLPGFKRATLTFIEKQEEVPHA
jgi:hypothetical protein